LTELEEEKEYYVIVFKFSHVFDAISMLNYIQKFSNTSMISTPGETSSHVKISMLNLGLKFVTFFCELSELVFYIISRFLSSLKEFENTQNTNIENNHVISVTRYFPLEKLRQVKAKHSSVNGITVVFTANAEALKLHLKNLPPNLKVFIPLPIPGYDGSLTNHT
jgi:hypothetical protein